MEFAQTAVGPAVPTTVENLLGQHSTNPVYETGQTTATNKEWTKSYAPITQVTPRSERGWASFEPAFLELDEDDEVRWREPAYPPNYRSWRLEMEEDVAGWFNAEVSNVVLAAWGHNPELLQASHAKPLTATPVNNSVDVLFSFRFDGIRVPIAIGEFKRNIIDPASWETPNVHKSQNNLSRELRRYADKYSCPQVFCFDGTNFLMLQFRAKTRSDIKDAKCEVDSWILPRAESATTLRLALYRLLTQGFRRCQSTWLTNTPLFGHQPHYREFFNGRPVFKIQGDSVVKPWGLIRRINAEYGAFYWASQAGPLQGDDGMVVYDTDALWGPVVAQEQQVLGSTEVEEADEDLYDA